MNTSHIPDTWKITVADRRTFITDDQQKPRCGTQTRGNGTPCMNKPMDNGRCRLHGGKMSQGEQHPSFKTGAHSRFRKHLPDRLKTIYDEYAQSADLDSLDPSIILLDVRMSELIERLEKGDYGATYDKLREVFYSADRALRGKEMEDFAQYWLEIRRLIETGSKDYGLWSQIVNLNDRRGKMVERKHNILHKSDMTITINQFVQALRSLEGAFDEAAELPTVVQRRKHFSTAVMQLLTPAIDHDSE